jgi:hypothetical protein
MFREILMLRRVWAFLIAPFLPAFFQSAVVALWPKEGMGVFENPPSMVVAVCIYYYTFGLLFGLPVWMVLRLLNAMSLRAFAVAGLVVGLLPVSIALAWMVIQGSASAYVVTYNAIFFGLGGMVAGSTFWLIAKRSLDRTSSKQATT